jgi:peptidylprolyl isomerase/FKBP-type peptidyl-prolyl cis-trans isomerase FkpA
MKQLMLTISAILLSITVACTKKDEKKADTVATPEVTDLLMQETVKGKGEEAKDGMMVKIHYTGTFVDGKKFDSSLDRGQPFEFTLGQKQVIEGMEIGVRGMTVGSKRTLLIPAKMAYGEKGAGNVIPPNTPLKFEIELLEVAKANDSKTKKN